MGILVDLAKEILQQAEALEAQLENASAPQPTFDPGSPLSYPTWSKHPEIFRTRTALIDASKSMFQLALGPCDVIRSMSGVSKAEGFILNALIHYDIANLVPKHGSTTFAKLASKVNVQPELLERMLRIAFSMNVFKEEPAGSVSHTSLSQATSILSAWTCLQNRRDFSTSFSSWPASMAVYTEPHKQGVRQLPYNIGNNTDARFFEVINAEPDGMKKFGEAMRGLSLVAGIDPSYLVDCLDWASLGSGPVVDLGGGNGHISIMLAEKFPNLHFIVQDLQPSEEPANSLIPSNLKNRVSFQVQDFFKPQVQDTGAKVFMIRAVMHDWQDEECAQILKHLIPEVERGAKILIVDRILPPPGRKPTHIESFILVTDMVMFSLLGAKERNTAQWKIIVEQTDPRLKIVKTFQPEGSEFGVVEIGM